MTPIELGKGIINNTFSHMLPETYGSREARVMLLAIGLQESKFTDRIQFGDGPAHGFWQNELGGMIKGVFSSTDQTIQSLVRSACALAQVNPNPVDVFNLLIMPSGDLLACTIARIGLLMDRAPLPQIGDESGALKCYLRNWRPGRPRLGTWPAYYQAAVEAFPS